MLHMTTHDVCGGGGGELGQFPCSPPTNMSHDITWPFLSINLRLNFVNLMAREILMINYVNRSRDTVNDSQLNNL